MVLSKENSGQIQTLNTVRQSSHKQEYGSYRAYFLMAIANVCMILMQFCFKKLSVHFSSSILLATRGSFLVVINYFLMKREMLDAHVKDPQIFRMLVKRSIVSGMSVAFYIGSIKYLPIGITNALQNTSPIITFFIEIFYYKKGKIHWINLIIILASFIGVILIVEPEFLFGKNDMEQGQGIYYVMVLAGALSSSLSMIFLHDLRGKVKQLVALNHGYLFQAFSNSLIYMIVSSGSSDENFLSDLSIAQICVLVIYFLFLCLFAFLNQFYRAKAIFLCSPALVLPFNYLTVIFGVFVDIVFFDSSYSTLKIFGMILASFGLFSKFILLYIQNNKEQP